MNIEDLDTKLCETTEPMSEEEVLILLNGAGDYMYADEILQVRMPNASRRFKSVVRSMRKLLDDVREHFPDAEYYTSGGDGFSLLLGRSHGDDEHAQQELAALDAGMVLVGGGDW